MRDALATHDCTPSTLRFARACAQEVKHTQVFAHRFPLRAMRFNLSLLFGIMGVLATQSKDPDDSDGLRQAYIDLNMARIEIASLKLEVVRLKEELGECSEGHVCFMVVTSAILPPVMSSHRRTVTRRHRDLTVTDTLHAVAFACPSGHRTRTARSVDKSWTNGETTPWFVDAAAIGSFATIWCETWFILLLTTGPTWPLSWKSRAS